MKIRYFLLVMAVPIVLLHVASGCGKTEDEGKEQKTTVEFEPSEKPAQRKVNIIVLEDKRCTERDCEIAPVIKKLGKSFKGLHVERHDWSGEKCKKILEREGLKFLPVFLFDESVKENPDYKQMARYLVPTPLGDLLQLKYPAEFDPRAEICNNGKDDTGNGKVDCDDPACGSNAVCRDEVPARLDVFTMSQCPFGTKALDSMEEVLGALEGRIDFRIHFIAREKGDGFRSLHGQPEVEENIREICAIKHYPKNRRYMKYIWCRNRKIKDKNWKACTGKNGIDARVIEKCSTGEEGKALLREDIKLAGKLGIGASPTWLANNRFIFSALSPESIKQNLCKRNKGLKGCEKKLSNKSLVPAGSVCR